MVASYILSFADSEVVTLDRVVPEMFKSDIAGCPEVVYSLVKDEKGAAMALEDQAVLKIVNK